MKRLKILILIFCLAVSIPLAYVVWQTYQSMDQEEIAQLRFFSEALFDEMEAEMAQLVQREENRAVDEYHFTLADGKGSSKKSPLARQPEESYILGYLQNNPDGSFQSPQIPDMGRVNRDQRQLVSQLKTTNTIFNGKKFALPSKPAPAAPKAEVSPQLDSKKKSKKLFADRYISKQQQPRESKAYLGRKTIRKEEISAQQALNISKEDQTLLRSRRDEKAFSAPSAAVEQESAETPADTLNEERAAGSGAAPIVASLLPGDADTAGFQVEVAPLQSVFISTGRFFIFRRVAINNQLYRQGFVLEVEPFLQHLAAKHFEAQPMAGFTALQLRILENGSVRDAVRSGIQSSTPDMITQRTFPAPFDFLSAALNAGSVPPSPARKTLGIAIGILGLFMLLGLFAIYQSAHTVVDLSERRSQFVSSVTHELKTPLTNIRMYIEMLEQGIAATPEREQDYMRILGTESARLSHLINNVLELAKLEKKQRHFDMQEGNLEEVFTEVRTVMAHKVQQEGFQFEIRCQDMPVFSYDRDVIIQVLINLIENSIKFGRSASEKRITLWANVRDGNACIAVSDTGPGIPRHALNKVFDDFYRVDNDLTRTTGGTGIGLALVKKFVTAMGGKVKAANNTGAGCTITLMMPLSA